MLWRRSEDMSEKQPVKIRVMIVDDHMMVRDGLKVFLSVFDDIEVVAEAGDGETAVTRCQEHQPDVILMDILMPGMDGPTATARIRESFPRIQVIALTNFVDTELVQRAIRSGAISYLLKDVHAGKLYQAIQDAYQGEATLAYAAAKALVQGAKQASQPQLGRDLTPRERDVLALLVDGKTNKEIAARLNIRPGTVRLHVSNILAKLAVSNRTEAAMLAVQHKLLS